MRKQDKLDMVNFIISFTILALAIYLIVIGNSNRLSIAMLLLVYLIVEIKPIGGKGNEYDRYYERYEIEEED